jgi:multimeric flavodoxin WrbA
MAMTCFSGGKECTGCMACQEQRDYYDDDYYFEDDGLDD